MNNFVLPTVKAGDIVEILLDAVDAEIINSGRGYSKFKQIISHKTAPKPEPIVIWQYKYEGQWVNGCEGAERRKLILDTTTGTFEIEYVK